VPLYEYQCPSCGRFEVIQKFADAPLGACPTCAQPVQKLLSAPAFQFKGTGWYVTDYARKGGGGATETGEGAGKSEGSKDASAAPSSTPKSESTSQTAAAPSGSPSK
jgi:putative FmdB family regulatory protein